MSQIEKLHIMAAVLSRAVILAQARPEIISLYNLAEMEKAVNEAPLEYQFLGSLIVALRLMALPEAKVCDVEIPA